MQYQYPLDYILISIYLCEQSTKLRYCHCAKRRFVAGLPGELAAPLVNDPGFVEDQPRGEYNALCCAVLKPSWYSTNA